MGDLCHYAPQGGLKSQIRAKNRFEPGFVDTENTKNVSTRSVELFL
jgi:hypothetical protein